MMENQDEQTQVVVSYRLLPPEHHEETYYGRPTGEEPNLVILQEIAPI
jgi:hypothetical protein